MQDTYTLVAPREKSRAWKGDLKRVLFEGGGPDVVRLLAIPIRPKRLSQIPSIYPPANSQCECRAAEATTEGSPHETQDGRCLKRKADGEEGSSQHQKLARTKSGKAKDNASTTGLITFSDLPVELHRQIFGHVQTIQDTICLGLISRYFWVIAIDYVHEHYASFFGQWAGQNIVNVGEAVEPADYPPGLFSKKELDKLNKETVKVPDYDEDDLPWIPIDAVEYFEESITLHHFALDVVSNSYKDTDLSEESTTLFVECRNREKFKYDPAFKSTFRDLIAEEATYFPQDQPWILRNLTTREFVRSEAIALNPEFIHGPFIDVLGFGEVVLSRICWATRPCYSMDGVIPLHRGVWAGHSFDITTLAKHRSRTARAEWRDVSEEVATEIAEIWESKFGPDWREIICKRHGLSPRVHFSKSPLKFGQVRQYSYW